MPKVGQFRLRSSIPAFAKPADDRNAQNVTVTVGSLSVPVLFTGPARGYAEEDPVNIGLPRRWLARGVPGMSGHPEIKAEGDKRPNSTMALPQFRAPIIGLCSGSCQGPDTFPAAVPQIEARVGRTT